MAASGQTDLRGNRYGHLPLRKRVITVSTNTTGLDLTAAESGAIIYLEAMTTIQVRLPKISSLALGLTYDICFINGGQAGDGVTVMCASTADSSAQLRGVYTSASTVSTAQEASPATTEFDCFARVTAVSSINWMFESLSDSVENDGGAGTGDGYGTWTTGSTST